MYSGDSYLQLSMHASSAGKKPGTYAEKMGWQTKLGNSRQRSQSLSSLTEIEQYILQAQSNKKKKSSTRFSSRKQDVLRKKM